MGAVLNRSVAADGVIAYQDNNDNNKFHYLPARIDAVLGETLRDFQVTYYGINGDPYWADLGNRIYLSVVGGVLSGQAVPDITAAQQVSIAKAIKEKYGVNKPNLTPIILSQVKVTPVFAKSIVDIGSGGSTTFPDTVQFGTQFAYNVASGNSLFAELVARTTEQIGTNGNPDFAANITGMAEFFGDPWEAEIEADLSQVWKYTRTKISTGVSFGFINIGAHVDKITQELIKDGIVKITFKEGNGGAEFGRQMLESTKALFEAISAQVTKGEGLFRFDPNPDPQPPAKDDKWGSSLLPWTASVNMSFPSNYFKQEIKFSQTISFTGTLKVPVNTSMSLAVGCNASTEKHFHDLQMGLGGCLTSEKSEGLQSRIRSEQHAKDAKIQQYFEWLEIGKINADTFAVLVATLNTINLTENVGSSESASGDLTLRRLSRDEVLARLADYERKVVSGRIDPAHLERHLRASLARP